MNLENTTFAVKSDSGVSAPQVSGNPPEAQPRWALVLELKRMSYKGSTDFWAWFQGLSAEERRVLMAAVD